MKNKAKILVIIVAPVLFLGTMAVIFIPKTAVFSSHNAEWAFNKDHVFYGGAQMPAPQNIINDIKKPCSKCAYMLIDHKFPEGTTGSGSRRVRLQVGIHMQDDVPGTPRQCYIEPIKDSAGAVTYAGRHDVGTVHSSQSRASGRKDGSVNLDKLNYGCNSVSVYADRGCEVDFGTSKSWFSSHKIYRYPDESIYGNRVRLNRGVNGIINKYGICREVYNGTGGDLFIPLKTSGEWTTFINNAPAGVSFSGCSC